MLCRADVVELDSTNSFDEDQELQECQSHLLRVVMEKWVEYKEELLEERVTESVLKHNTQTLEKGIIKSVRWTHKSSEHQMVGITLYRTIRCNAKLSGLNGHTR